MIKNSRQSIVQGVMVMSVLSALVAAALGGMNLLAASIQNVAASRVADIDEARRSVGFTQITVPTYFPEGITWPPSSIIGQRKPFPAVALEFRGTQGGSIALIIVQQLRSNDPRALQRVSLTNIQEETPYLIKKQQAILQVGTCGSASQCSQMRWSSDNVHHSVLFLGPPIELIRLAESMIH